MSLKNQFTDFITELQNSICSGLEELEPETKFRSDFWERDGGGGGHTRVVSDGKVWEKGGVNISEVHGELPELIRQRFNVAQGWFHAAGISLVIHPRNPFVPTVHANYRYFELYDEKNGEPVDAWFGGGADLTPYYLFDEDARHFHQTHKNACDKISEQLYPKYKQDCDSYFFNAHRGEARGIGGIFYDYHRTDKNFSLNDWFDLAQSCGNAFLDAYLPIAKNRMDTIYQDAHRYWQEIRRGRYVEFNLIHDRGTLFGLKTNGRVESILMSLPPRVRWDYDYNPEDGSQEAKLLDVLKNPKNWLE